jgi:hypothetical protein
METLEKTRIETLSSLSINYTVREDEMDGRKHLVVPVVMMVPGVHNGSGGPILHTGEELARWTEAWNGIPVTISHPKKKNKPVSANSPEVLDSSSVGRIFNTVYNDGLKAEAWIDYDKISEMSEEALDSIVRQEPLDVSVGVFSDSETAEEGAEWNGEPYGKIAINYRPDHLALLPGEIGACSWKDGCGIRNNKKGGNTVKDLLKTFQELSQKGFVVSPIVNEAGYREIQENLASKLRDLNQDGVYHYIEEVFDTYIVYSKWLADGGETLYKQGYSIDDNNNIVFDGTQIEVRKKVEYVTNKMRRATRVNNQSNKGGDNMSTEGKSPCCLAKIEKLISNERTHFTEEDKEWLLTQEEGTLDKMFPKEASPPAKAEAPQVNKEEVIETFKGSLTKIEDFTELMPEAMKAEVEGGVKLYKENREALVKSILDNTAEGVWEEAVLVAMDDSTLEKISKTIKTPVDYSAQGAGGGQSAASGEQVELPVEYTDSGKEDK